MNLGKQIKKVFDNIDAMEVQREKENKEKKVEMIPYSEFIKNLQAKKGN